MKHNLAKLKDELAVAKFRRSAAVVLGWDKNVDYYLVEEARLKKAIAAITMSPKQKRLAAKHGTPAEFAKACYDTVPEFCSMDEARIAIEKYNKEWSNAG
jgi:hypothetical protein